ncbi:hypothetical protein [uncultured Tateyamaria sp.]|nr:hypothetical protein [uncultured Tateyamaria sp.]
MRDVIYSVDTEGGGDASSDPFGGMERCRTEGWSTPLDAVEQ